MKEDLEILVNKDYLSETFKEIRQDIRDAKKEVIRIMFLLSVAYELILIGFIIDHLAIQGVVTATGKTFPLKNRCPVSAKSATYLPISKAITGDS